MLSLERVKEILHQPDIPDAELLEIRDHFQTLSEIIFEAWQQERIAERSQRQAATMEASRAVGKEVAPRVNSSTAP